MAVSSFFQTADVCWGVLHLLNDELVGEGLSARVDVVNMYGFTVPELRRGLWLLGVPTSETRKLRRAELIQYIHDLLRGEGLSARVFKHWMHTYVVLPR